MIVDVWSDVVCPWCYLGKRRLELAIGEAGLAGEVEVRWRSYELDPHAPPGDDRLMTALVARKYGISEEQARAGQENLTRMAAEVGLRYDLPATRRSNTFDAHRLLQLAGTDGSGRQDALGEALFAAYFSEGRRVGDHEVLRELASAAGLDGRAVDDVLAGDRFAAEVRRDERLAVEMGSTGVPFFVFDGRYAVPGAQDVELFTQVLRRVAGELAGDEPGASRQ